MHARRPGPVLMTILTCLPCLARTDNAPAGDAIELRLDVLEVTNREASQAGAEIHLDAVPGAGFAWIKGLDMNEGCLSLEVKGSNEFGRSFVGIAFRALDADTYDTVYVLRQLHAGVYEKSIGSRPLRLT